MQPLVVEKTASFMETQPERSLPLKRDCQGRCAPASALLAAPGINNAAARKPRFLNLNLPLQQRIKIKRKIKIKIKDCTGAIQSRRSPRAARRGPERNGPRRHSRLRNRRTGRFSPSRNPPSKRPCGQAPLTRAGDGFVFPRALPRRGGD